MMRNFLAAVCVVCAAWVQAQVQVQPLLRLVRRRFLRLRPHTTCH